MPVNFKNVFLSDYDIRVLQELEDGRILTAPEGDVHVLLNLNFVQHYALSKEREEKFVITGEGLRYLEYLHKAELRAKKQALRDRLTTAAAIIGAVTGVASLLMQLLRT